MRSMLVMALLAMGSVAACRSASSDATGSPAARAPVDAAGAPAIASTTAAAPASSVDPADSAATPRSPGGTDVTAALDGSEVRLRWGIAGRGAQGLVVELLAEPFDCSKKSFAGFPLSHTAALLSFEVPSGPGGHFYAGRPVGVEVRLDDPSRGEVLNGLPLGMGKARSMAPTSVAVTLEPFRLERGARARGRIGGAETMLIGSAEAHGDFDVEVCDSPEPSFVQALRDAAPAGSLRGRIGTKAVAPGTALAIVRHRPTSHGEAIDLALGRLQGGLAGIWEIDFHAAAGVACPDPKGPGKPGGLFHVQGIGGAGVDHDLTGTQQPATVVLHAGSDTFAGVWQAWIELDSLALRPGDKVSGVLWAQSAPNAFPDKKGTLGGRFEALVCEQ